MVRNTPTLHGRLAAAIAVVALAVPATSVAMPYRHHSDSPAAALEAQRDTQRYQDLRSPDAKHVGGAATQASAAAQPPAAPEIVQDPGFDWGDAGIGAGSVVGLLLVMLSVMFAVVHRRSRGVEGPGGPAITT